MSRRTPKILDLVLQGYFVQLANKPINSITTTTQATGTAAHAAHSNDLIVNFVERDRLADSYSSSNGEETRMDVKKQVRFGEDITTYHFQYPDEYEISRRWISTDEKSLFSQEVARDVRILRCLLSSTPMENVDEETLYECLGLECHLSNEVMQLIKERRKRHPRLIVQMQHKLDQDQLAAYSISRSLESRERAQKLASGYFTILS
jgi:hypothetical protein